MKKTLFTLAFFSLIFSSFAQKKINFNELPDLVNEAEQKKDFIKADSIAQVYIKDYLLKLKEADLLTKENLIFISKHLTSADDKAFKLFEKKSKKVNAILGDRAAQNIIMAFINKNYLPAQSSWETVYPNWDSLEKAMGVKFGNLGLETVWGQRMIYQFEKKSNWTEYAKYYTLYFEKAYKHPVWNINNMSWYIFDKVNDKKTLDFACNVVMKYAMETWYQDDWQSYDTYANLLYKTGRKDQAIEWEEKALKLSNNDKEIGVTLDKMQKGLPTWTITANN